MGQSKHRSAYKLLTSIAQQSEQHSVQLPSQGAVQSQWRGVGFRLAGMRFVAPMEEVDEVLYVPSYTSFPGVKSWVNGVSNVRGRLLSLIDLGVYFGQKPSLSSKTSRILCVKLDDLYTGLIVEQVLGMQALEERDRVQPEKLPKEFRPFVTGGFQQNGTSWTIFSLSELVKAPEFLQVAL